MKFLVNILRIFVGSLFVFSGLVKINDPVGFSFKLEEYFGPTVFDIDFLMNFGTLFRPLLHNYPYIFSIDFCIDFYHIFNGF